MANFTKGNMKYRSKSYSISLFLDPLARRKKYRVETVLKFDVRFKNRKEKSWFLNEHGKTC